MNRDTKRVLWWFACAAVIVACGLAIVAMMSGCVGAGLAEYRAIDGAYQAADIDLRVGVELGQRPAADRDRADTVMQAYAPVRFDAWRDLQGDTDGTLRLNLDLMRAALVELETLRQEGR